METKHTDLCEIECVEQEKVERVQNELTAIPVSPIAQWFKILGDETRLKIAYSLAEAKELCVCDVAYATGCSIATASHHLRTLKKAGLAKYRKEGKRAFYSLDDAHVTIILELSKTHAQHVARSEADN
ncbi:ArsR/SmtB family transcription factor [Bacillus fonticola]|uniref:ArsR/SmtB family transcription factor n=1 Tax=Bacillus fonticola TaxID=2728853 RepID=UPI0014730BA5|nr:metalloregulator ArsR/SmtB family transcription factor [Bacillus fonticola]